MTTPMTTCKHCKRPTNAAAIDYNQDGKCLVTFNPESKSYSKGCGYESAGELDQKIAGCMMEWGVNVVK
ncbi:hypothetical protein [Vibrio sp. TBV020]|uniref:hypothetical protein n=1 Tax=Vibrio sp. TBV020 TaxID=3137398 RepID=UPI0038CD402A